MLQPNEMKWNLPVELPDGSISTTAKVWEVLTASYNNNQDRIKKLAEENPSLLYAPYNYMPPIHLAVRQGHVELVDYLLRNGACDPSYRTYPFLDDLNTIAEDRGYHEIVFLVKKYNENPRLQSFKGDNSRIIFNRTGLEKDFEEAVDRNDMALVEKLLQTNPALALDETFFWGEGILVMPAKENQRALIDLLMQYGARVPPVLKWTQEYYLKKTDGAAYMMKKGMTPNTMSCHRVSLLHDMAQKGNIAKAELLIRYGADMDAIDDEYQSTPLGLAVRWGQTEMVHYLLQQGADMNKTGAHWARPLAWAKKKGWIDIEEALINAGASQ